MVLTDINYIIIISDDGDRVNNGMAVGKSVKKNDVIVKGT